MSAELERRALRLLARREHTREELARKLAPEASNPQLASLFEKLEARGFLSEARYAEVRARQLARKFGFLKIRRELVAKGVAAETATRFAADLRKSDLERARAILQRKFKSDATSPQERARRMRFLYSRGFSQEVIRAALRESSADPE